MAAQGGGHVKRVQHGMRALGCDEGDAGGAVARAAENHRLWPGDAIHHGKAGGADARLMRRLADQRALDDSDVARASGDARALLQDWFEAGWLHLESP